MFNRQTIQIVLLVWGCIFCLIAAMGMFLSDNYDKEKRRTLFCMQLFTAILLGSDALAYGFRGYPGRTGWWMVTISNFLVFALSNVILLFFHTYVCCYLFTKEQKNKIIRVKIGYGISAVGLLMVIASQFTHLYYYIDANNLYHRNPAYIISMLIPVAVMLLDLSLLVQYHKNIRKKIFLSMLSYIILPVLAALMQWFLYGLSLINVSICISMIIMYMAATSEMNREIYLAMRKKEEAEEHLAIETTLNNCIRELSSEDNIYDSINNLLHTINDYFQADRSYIFELKEDGRALSNTHEYVREGVTPQKDNLQEVPLEVISAWLEYFQKDKVYFISDLEQEKGSVTYDMLREQQVERLLAVPLARKEKILGFLGVDNPQKHYNDATLLSSIQYFITNSLVIKKQQEQLLYLSYSDHLTQIYNRNKYMEVLDELREETLKKTGVAYIDLNGLKRVNDRQGHNAGDQLIHRAATVISEVFGGQVYRIGGDEFVLICPWIEKEEFDKKIADILQGMEQNKISISLGKVWQEDQINIDDMLKEADHLMYLEKEDYHRKNGGSR